MQNKHPLFTGDETPMQMKQILMDNSDDVEMFDYSKPLTEDQLVEAREKFAKANVALIEIEDKLSEAKRVAKEAAKPLKLEAGQTINLIKTKSIPVQEKVFIMKDHINKMAEYVNEEGFIVHTRRLRPDEVQTSIAQMRKAE